MSVRTVPLIRSVEDSLAHRALGAIGSLDNVAATARPRWHAPVVALVAAVVISLAGALVWSRTVARDTADVDAILDTPGEYLEPGAATNPPLPIDRWPPVELTTAAGDGVTLAPDGRPMVVNLWYSTCPPCARELAALASVHDDVGDAVRFVGVNPYDSASVMSRFAAERGVTYELLRDEAFALADELAIVAYPVTLFVDIDGGIRAESGSLNEDELRRRLADYWTVS